MEPPGVPANVTSSPAWFQTSGIQLRSSLTKVDTEITEDCCALDVALDPGPKLKIEGYDLMIGRSTARSLYLLSLVAAIDFAKEYSCFFYKVL